LLDPCKSLAGLCDQSVVLYNHIIGPPRIRQLSAKSTLGK
jgi:hypothetical protein